MYYKKVESADNKKKWVVKLEDGRLKGPYTTARVLEKIELGAFGGDELIALYPGGNWFPISRDPVFYDKLLEVLSSDHGERPLKQPPSSQEKISSKQNQKTHRSTVKAVDARQFENSKTVLFEDSQPGTSYEPESSSDDETTKVIFQKQEQGKKPPPIEDIE
ncbi:MAG: hypothetical protein KDD34_09250, partial [Bdellovibrionales bacterium]|nr:hypothetical protein [Bdellovibrionales bacterium]